jgi:hypothetical protein
VPATPPPPSDRSSHGRATAILDAELCRLRDDLEQVDDADDLDAIEAEIRMLAAAKIAHARAIIRGQAA